MADESGASLLLLRGAEVYSPEALGTQDILVVGGEIGAMAPSLPALPAAFPHQEIDLSGKRLLPGLIDCHVHLTGGGGESGPASRVPPLGLQALTKAGVTTVVGVLGTDGVTRSVADLLAATRSMEALGLSAYCYTGSYQLPPPTLINSVREDIVHVAQIIGAGEIAISDHRSSQPTFDEIAKLAADVHVAGLMTGKAGVLHLHMGDGQRGLSMIARLLEETELPARTFHPTHCNRNRRLWAEAKALSQRFDLTIDVTAFPPDDPDPQVMSAAEAIQDWLASGCDPLRLTVSSDGGGCLPVFNPQGEVIAMGVGTSATLPQTLGILLQQGLTLPQVLPMFTSNVARQFRFHRKGRIATGMDADLVTLDAQGQIVDVFAKGRWMLRDGKATVRDTYDR